MVLPLQATAFSQSPLVTFLFGLFVVIALLVWLDFPAFMGLILAAFSVGVVNAVFVPEFTPAEAGTAVAEAFGSNMAGIGIPILAAAVIGKSMLESGAAQRVVRGFQNVLGEENSDIALLGSSSVLAVPVFFDSVFYLMAPLARSMRARVGRDYTLFIVVVGAGAASAHVFVPPTPGPLAVAAEIGSNLGVTILIGVVTAVPAAVLAGLVYGRWINTRLDIPLRDTMSTTTDELQEVADRPTSTLPGMLESLAPILVAVGLIGSFTIVDTAQGLYPSLGTIEPVVVVLGNKNVALMIAAVVAAYSFYRHNALTQTEWSEELTEALKSGGNIAAITAAGGAFGAMLAASGIGEYLGSALAEVGIGLLVTAWLIAAIVRIAQGSATAAMLTSAGIMAPLVGQLAVHPAYLVMAIGAGGNIFSWYNDSGFWLVKEIGGLTQAETLKTWTVLTTIISVSGLLTTLLVSSVFPLV
ncbi:low affinity gluconate transporter [Halalkalicoccus paucihalophilus]|uniref:Low affinity gluconate transporter n=1 Tax=Halalkalicoccus paucihalophilus TaxID=1008153 RepID=A0A151ABP1_9EURY|nr:SLC13 family permease [Halalkalicoccus paucihalophilus]KYH25101.1 low affinity gluconate transporter [Halalkalicoccus paucihalophilus]